MVNNESPIYYTEKLLAFRNTCEDLALKQDFILREVVSRVAYLALSVGFIFSATFDFIRNSVKALSAIYYLGENKDYNDRIPKVYWAAVLILKFPLMHLLKVINPSAEISLTPQSNLLTSVTKPIYVKCNSFKDSEHWFVRHVVSRTSNLLLPIVSLVANIANTAIGTIAFSFAILTGGLVQDLNNFAAGHLVLSGSLVSIFALLEVLNPDIEFSDTYDTKYFQYHCLLRDGVPRQAQVTS